MLFTTLLLIILPLVVFYIYRWATKNNDYFRLRKIPFLRPTLFLGNTGPFILRSEPPNKYIERIYRSFPDEKIFGLFEFRTPALMLRDPETIKQLIVKDFEHFVNHRQVLNENIETIFSKSLVMLKGEKWQHTRSTLSPAFTGSKLRQMFELVNECSAAMATVLSNKLASDGDNISMDMKDLFSKYAMDVIATTAFGIKINSMEDDKNEFMTHGRNLLSPNTIKITIKVIISMLSPRFFKYLKWDFFEAEVKRFFYSIVFDTMDVRKRDNIVRPDMIQLLMPVRKGNQTLEHEVPAVDSFQNNDDGFAAVHEPQNFAPIRREWSDDDIIAQCFLFFLAGFETTSSVLSFLAYELALNPVVQETLFEECLKTQSELDGSHKGLPYEVLLKMKYMDQVVSESLRMWPTAIFTDRVCNKDYEYDDGKLKFTIKKDTTLWLPIYALHHDEKYFPNPEKFRPERFSEENKANIVPGTFMPFGIGPRSCIASRFALMEIKSLIYHLVLKFRIEPNEKTQIPLKLSSRPGANTEKGIHLQLKLR